MSQMQFSRRYLAAGAGVIVCAALAVLMMTVDGTTTPWVWPPLAGGLLCAELLRRWADDTDQQRHADHNHQQPDQPV